MKTLILMRHAKAEDPSLSLTDRHRSLTEQGIDEAKKSGKKLANLKVKIDALIASPSNRTIETSRIIKNKLDNRLKSWSVQERLYGADLDTLLQVIGQTPQKVKTLMLVGHNPGLEECAEYFLHSPCHLKTGDLILFKFDTKTWSDISEQRPLRTRSMEQL